MHRKQGFTLIELLVVIAIIGILATLVVTQIGTSRVKARNSTAQADVTEAGKAIEVFKNDDQASDQVITDGNGTGAQMAVLGNQTSNTTATGNFTSLFTGTANWVAGGTGNTYGVKFTQTPGVGYVYAYAIKDTGTNASRAAANGTAGSMIGVESGCYLFATNIKPTQSGQNDGVFYYRNGNTNTIAASAGGSSIPLPNIANGAAAGSAYASGYTPTGSPYNPFGAYTYPAGGFCNF